MSHDNRLFHAKKSVTEMICELTKETTRFTIMDLAGRIDELNAAWDALTDALVRQRTVRDETIEHLHSVIANERKP